MTGMDSGKKFRVRIMINKQFFFLIFLIPNIAFCLPRKEKQTTPEFRHDGNQVVASTFTIFGSSTILVAREDEDRRRYKIEFTSVNASVITPIICVATFSMSSCNWDTLTVARLSSATSMGLINSPSFEDFSSSAFYIRLFGTPSATAALNAASWYDIGDDGDD